MPRFYFHLYDDVETRDPDGLELVCVASARLVAIDELRRLYALQRDPPAKMSDRIDITDEAGRVIDTVCFADVV